MGGDGVYILLAHQIGFFIGGVLIYQKLVPLTHEYILVEVLTNRRCVLLNIPWVVVIRAIVFPGLEGVGVFYHFVVEAGEAVVWDDVFDDDETIAMQAVDRGFEVLR